MKKNPPSPEALLKLLSDEDDIARIAMIQLLLNYGHESDEILRQLQECDDPVLRKRSHQMQALLTFKQRKMDLFNILQRRNGQFFFSDILQAMHLVWFDQDSSAELSDLYRSLLKEYPLENGKSFETLCRFMKEQQFVALPDSTATGNLFMLGAVLDSKYGSNSFLSALALAITEDLQFDTEIKIILFEHKFYLYEPQNNLICDLREHWRLKTLNFNDFQIFDRIHILKFMTALCFCNAVNDDAFRYIQILGEMLSPTHQTNNLPYPYSGSNA